MAVDFNLSLKNSSWKIATPSKITSMLPFYIEFIGNYETNPDFYTKRDSQQSYLFIYTVKGQASISINQTLHTLTPNSIILINCNDYHFFRPLSSDWHYMWIHVNGFGIISYFKILYNSDPFPIQFSEQTSFIDIFNELFMLVDKPSIYNHILISNIISNILTEMSSGFLMSHTNKSNYYISEAIDYIENNYTDNIKIEDIARHLYISKYYLIKLFNQFLGVSPYQYIIEHRIGKSKNLLISGELSIGDIARYVGFNSLSHYIKLFKQYEGISPGKYRNEHKLEIR